MKKRQLGFTIVEIMVVAVIISLIGLLTWFSFASRAAKPVHTLTTSQTAPHSVEEAANDYLSARVGSANFKRLYTFDKAKSSYATPEDSQYDFMAYHFAPLKAITSYNDIIMVQVNRNKLGEIFADAVPDCVADHSQCTFLVDKSKALEIARAHQLTAEDVAITWGNMNNTHAEKQRLAFVVIASSCTQNKSLYIDYRNGAILGSEANCGIGLD